MRTIPLLLALMLIAPAASAQIATPPPGPSAPPAPYHTPSTPRLDPGRLFPGWRSLPAAKEQQAEVVAPSSTVAPSVPLPTRKGAVVCQPIQCLQDDRGQLSVEFIVVGPEWATLRVTGELWSGVQSGDLFIHADGRTRSDREAEYRREHNIDAMARTQGMLVDHLIRYRSTGSGYLRANADDDRLLLWLTTRLDASAFDVQPLEGEFMRVTLSKDFVEAAEKLARSFAQATDDDPGPYFEYRDQLMQVVLDPDR